MKIRKTRDKIIDISLDLFNKKKASNVSTVQISAAMNISPGNLYYYFKNKEDIIKCIWEERMCSVIEDLVVKAEETKTVSDLIEYIQEWIRHLIEYRFFYSELSTLFINDERLVELYNNSEKKTIETFASLVNMRMEGVDEEEINVAKMIVIHSSISMAFQQICYYDAYITKGKTQNDFIGLSLLRITNILDAVFSEKTMKEINKQLLDKGFSKDKYLDLCL